MPDTIRSALLEQAHSEGARYCPREEEASCSIVAEYPGNPTRTFDSQESIFSVIKRQMEKQQITGRCTAIQDIHVPRISRARFLRCEDSRSRSGSREPGRTKPPLGAIVDPPVALAWTNRITNSWAQQREQRAEAAKQQAEEDERETERLRACADQLVDPGATPHEGSCVKYGLDGTRTRHTCTQDRHLRQYPNRSYGSTKKWIALQAERIELIHKGSFVEIGPDKVGQQKYSLMTPVPGYFITCGRRVTGIMQGIALHLADFFGTDGADARGEDPRELYRKLMGTGEPLELVTILQRYINYQYPLEEEYQSFAETTLTKSGKILEILEDVLTAVYRSRDNRDFLKNERRDLQKMAPKAIVYVAGTDQESLDELIPMDFSFVGNDPIGLVYTKVARTLEVCHARHLEDRRRVGSPIRDRRYN